MKTTMIASWTSTKTVLKLATRFTLLMLMRVMISTNITTQIHGATSGNNAVR